ncbi:MAG: glycosyltransferase family 4 protein [Armatimonadetes bacterium]|nr:glycosyltransferase family 4 protein [Armatimonadota bacterium]
MRVTYLHQYANLPEHGGPTRSYEMARRLAAAGHQVNLVTSDHRRLHGSPGRWTVTEQAGFTAHWYGLAYANQMGYASRAAAFVRFAAAAAARSADLPADVVYATSTPLTIALPGVWAARRQRCPMVFEVRDLWPEVPIALGALPGPLAPAARRLERFAYHNSARVVALSPGMRDGVIAAGYPAERITVVPNSCDFDVFDLPPTAGQAIRERTPWLGGRPLALYAGALGKVNGVSAIVRLARHMGSLQPDVRFAIIGDGREEAIVRELALETGVLGASLFMLPPMPKPEVARWLSAATITMSTVINVPQLWPNSANKFFDSLAAGRPIAINHGGWQADLLAETGAGLVLHPTDAADAAAALSRALSDPRWLSGASAAAAELGRSRFSRDALARDLERALREASGRE